MVLSVNDFYKEIPSLDNLKQFFLSLPGVGPKTAQRYSLYVVQQNDSYKKYIISTINNIINKVHFCPKCGMITEKDLCFICSQEHKREKTICVVEKYEDVFTIEKSGYKGLYHILNGLISPLDGINPNDLNIDTLIDRVKTGKYSEIIFALSPIAEGETTIFFILDKLKDFDIKKTRISYGLPHGSTIEYTSALTLKKSIEERQVV